MIGIHLLTFLSLFYSFLGVVLCSFLFCLVWYSFVVCLHSFLFGFYKSIVFDLWFPWASCIMIHNCIYFKLIVCVLPYLTDVQTLMYICLSCCGFFSFLYILNSYHCGITWEMNIKRYLKITHIFSSAVWHLLKEIFDSATESLNKVGSLKKHRGWL